VVIEVATLGFGCQKSLADRFGHLEVVVDFAGTEFQPKTLSSWGIRHPEE
jgi:hypothetical protein